MTLHKRQRFVKLPKICKKMFENFATWQNSIFFASKGTHNKLSSSKIMRQRVKIISLADVEKNEFVT